MKLSARKRKSGALSLRKPNGVVLKRQFTFSGIPKRTENTHTSTLYGVYRVKTNVNPLPKRGIRFSIYRAGIKKIGPTKSTRRWGRKNGLHFHATGIKHSHSLLNGPIYSMLDLLAVIALKCCNGKHSIDKISEREWPMNNFHRRVAKFTDYWRFPIAGIYGFLISYGRHAFTTANEKYYRRVGS